MWSETASGVVICIEYVMLNIVPQQYIATPDQECVKDVAAVLVFVAVYERTTLKYSERGVRYVHMEVGHAARNVYL